MNFFESVGEKVQLKKDLAFCALLKNAFPEKTGKFTDLFLKFDETVKASPSESTAEAKTVQGALNNAHGDWYEWLLAMTAWNLRIENPRLNLALLLPSVSSFDVSELYSRDLSDLINDLKEKVQEAASVKLITSNPDFVIIDGKKAGALLKKELTPIKRITPEVIAKIGAAYKEFEGKCDYEDIVGYASVKVSLRPDRRLQIPHEGSLMKALYTHLQTRKWIINPKGLKYYAISAELSDPDKNALRTVATHSITSVHTVPQAAVDDVFSVNSLKEAEAAFEKILS